MTPPESRNAAAGRHDRGQCLDDALRRCRERQRRHSLIAWTRITRTWRPSRARRRPSLPQPESIPARCRRSRRRLDAWFGREVAEQFAMRTRRRGWRFSSAPARARGRNGLRDARSVPSQCSARDLWRLCSSPVRRAVEPPVRTRNRLEAEISDRIPDEAGLDSPDARAVATMQRAIANQIDQPRRAARSLVDGIDRRARRTRRWAGTVARRCADDDAM